MNQRCHNLGFFTFNQVRKSKNMVMKTKGFYIKKKKENKNKNFAPRVSVYCDHHQHINNFLKCISDNYRNNSKQV